MFALVYSNLMDGHADVARSCEVPGHDGTGSDTYAGAEGDWDPLRAWSVRKSDLLRR